MRTLAKAFLALTILTVTLCSQSRHVLAAGELVKFDSATYRIGSLQQRLSRERGENATVVMQVTIEGYLSKPDGDGPFPAVVYLHGCNGLTARERERIAELMTSWGFVSLAVDSFATRGIKGACSSEQLMPARQADALGALFYLSRLAFVDHHRIAAMGSSQGGNAALQLASTHPVSIFDIPDELKFKAAVAFYPRCSVASDQLAIPTIVLIGEVDDWTPAKDCERWIERRAGRGASVKLVVYPGAYHSFDVPSLGDGLQYFGHWLKYDSDAAGQSASEVFNFLGNQLSK